MMSHVKRALQNSLCLEVVSGDISMLLFVMCTLAVQVGLVGGNQNETV